MSLSPNDCIFPSPNFDLGLEDIDQIFIAIIRMSDTDLTTIPNLAVHSLTDVILEGLLVRPLECWPGDGDMLRVEDSRTIKRHRMIRP